MAQKKTLGARGYRALLEHSLEFGGELETTHSLQLYKKKIKTSISKSNVSHCTAITHKSL